MRFPPKLSRAKIKLKKEFTQLYYKEKTCSFEGFFCFVPASMGGTPSPPRMPWSQPLMTYDIHENKSLCMKFRITNKQNIDGSVLLQAN